MTFVIGLQMSRSGACAGAVWGGMTREAVLPWSHGRIRRRNHPDGRLRGRIASRCRMRSTCRCRALAFRCAREYMQHGCGLVSKCGPGRFPRLHDRSSSAFFFLPVCAYVMLHERVWLLRVVWAVPLVVAFCLGLPRCRLSDVRRASSVLPPCYSASRMRACVRDMRACSSL